MYAIDGDNNGHDGRAGAAALDGRASEAGPRGVRRSLRNVRNRGWSRFAELAFVPLLLVPAWSGTLVFLAFRSDTTAAGEGFDTLPAPGAERLPDRKATY